MTYSYTIIIVIIGGCEFLGGIVIIIIKVKLAVGNNLFNSQSLELHADAQWPA